MAHTHDTHAPAHGHNDAHGHAGAGFDATDPHGNTHHEHVIIPARTLMAVLMALLVFTVLTVGLSRAEMWAADYFNLDIPQWVNVFIAMSIATVKGSLVLLYFMQLRYDNKLNAIIFLNCIFALGLFLFFTMIDLGNRDTIYQWKKGEIRLGGTGGVTRGSGDSVESVNTAVVDFAREKWLAEWGPEKYAAIKATMKHKDHAHHGPESNANASRVFTGNTGALLTTPPAPPAKGHAADPAGSHTADPAAEPTAKPETDPAHGGN